MGRYAVGAYWGFIFQEAEQDLHGRKPLLR